MKTATFTQNIFQGNYKSLFRASIGDTFKVEKETKNSVQLTNSLGITKWISKDVVKITN